MSTEIKDELRQSMNSKLTKSTDVDEIIKKKVSYPVFEESKYCNNR